MGYINLEIVLLLTLNRRAKSARVAAPVCKGLGRFLALMVREGGDLPR